VIIAAAGLAAHLPGVVAAWTPLPVIGVPVPAGELRGIDALYSMAQMPAGTPVACVAIGSHGARNAAHLAARILALKHESVRKALEDYRQKMASE
jgi:5-(carboxyamino)imidazole ribonucleotide mutase